MSSQPITLIIIIIIMIMIIIIIIKSLKPHAIRWFTTSGLKNWI